MPVDLSVSQSIISAYAQGKQEALQKEKLAREKEQQDIENKLRTEAAAEQTRQFNEQFRQAGEQFRASQALQSAQFNLTKALAIPEFQRLAEQSGSVPGFEKTPQQASSSAPVFDKTTGAAVSLDTTPIQQTSNTFKGTIPGLEDISFTARTPEEAAAQEAERQRTLMQPKVEADLQSELLKLQGQAQIESAKQQFEATQRAADRTSRESIADKNVRARIEAARISGSMGKETAFLANEVQRFKTSDVVKRYNDMKEFNDYAQNVGANGIGDYGLIATYAKITDPESVVRDGERNAVEKAATSLRQNFKAKIGRINEVVPFLDDNARALLKKEIKDRFTSTEKGYEKFRSETLKTLTNLNIENPEKYIPDYSGKTQEVTNGGNPVIKFEDLKGGKVGASK